MNEPILQALDDANAKIDEERKVEILAALCAVGQKRGTDRPSLLAGRQKSLYKRVIREIRATEAYFTREGETEIAALANDTVLYIREHCLSK